jgi:hypothetical protein
MEILAVVYIHCTYTVKNATNIYKICFSLVIQFQDGKENITDNNRFGHLTTSSTVQT